MTRRGEQLLGAFFSAHWAIDEEKFYSMLEVLDRWADGHRLSAEEIQARTGGGDRRKTPATEGSAIAVLPLHGLISHRAYMVEDSSFGGGTSAERFGQLFDQALADPKIGTIVLDIDSPGGNVSGVPELAAKILAAREQKRIIAVANSLSASAAYWIGSAASEFVAIPSGDVGSVGVFAVHTNTQRRDTQLGIDRTILRADIGPHKAELSPHGPLSREAADFVKEQLNDWGLQFVDALAKHRGVSTAHVRDRFGGGRTLTARQALTAKMIDRIATMEEVLAECGAGVSAKRTPMAQASADQLPTAAAEIDQIRHLTNQAVAPLVTSVTSAGTESHLTIHRTDVDGASSAAPSSPAAANPAQENIVSTQTTPAPGAGAPDASQTDELARLRAKHARDQEIRNYCSLVPGTTAVQMNEYLASDKTAEQVRQELEAKQGKPQPAAVHGVHDRALDKKFGSLGEQLVAVMNHGLGRGTDARLLEINRQALQPQAAATGMNETISSEGGFFIQEDLVDSAIEPIYRDDPLLSRVTRIPMTRNVRKFNIVDEESRTNGNRWGAIAMQWLAEGDTQTAKKPKTRRIELELKKLRGLGYITDEDKEDGPGAAVLLENAFQAESKFMLADAVFRGTGAGQPLGIKNSGAVVSVAIEAAQTIANSNQSIATNTAKMLARIPAWLRDQAIFLYNVELFPTIVTATLGSTSVPVFVPGGGMPNRPSDTIWGRPAFASEFCDAVGTPGDIMCVVPGEYYLGERGVRKSTSVEVGWLKDEEAIKIIIRVDGMPLWKTSLTPYKGANALSPFVTLATRA